MPIVIMLNVVLNVVILNVEWCYAECRYAECHYAECGGAGNYPCPSFSPRLFIQPFFVSRLFINVCQDRHRFLKK
jgi:hypothetical protein